MQQKDQLLADKLNQVIRIGFVTSRMPEKMRVRVRLPDTVTSPLVTDWLPVVCPRASGDMVYDLPDVGDQVLCIFLPNGMERGFVLGAMYGGNNPPVTSPDKYHRTFKDGTTLEYDRSSHKLTANVQGKVNITATETVTITAPTILLQGAISTTNQSGGTGSVSMNGTLRLSNGDISADSVSLKGHVHEGVQPGSGTTGTPVQ